MEKVSEIRLVFTIIIFCLVVSISFGYFGFPMGKYLGIGLIGAGVYRFILQFYYGNLFSSESRGSLHQAGGKA